MDTWIDALVQRLHNASDARHGQSDDPALESLEVEAANVILKMQSLLRAAVRVREAQVSGRPLVSNQGQGMDGFSALHNFNGIAKEAAEYLDED